MLLLLLLLLLVDDVVVGVSLLEGLNILLVRRVPSNLASLRSGRLMVAWLDLVSRQVVRVHRVSTNLLLLLLLVSVIHPRTNPVHIESVVVSFYFVLLLSKHMHYHHHIYPFSH